jgi:hypothetical protein
MVDLIFLYGLKHIAKGAVISKIRNSQYEIRT